MSTNAPDASQPEQTLPGGPAPKRLDGNRQRINDERIRDLINALGDSNHPHHSSAINELVSLGSEAVGPLCAALAPERPWLTAYRAAEALAQIGDGAASGPLMTALRHPNSNVRWSAVRALAEVGDTRTLWALRRVAHEDRGKTSWGESVADTAQLGLDRLQSRSALLRFTEPIKTTLFFVVLLASLLLAANRVQAVLADLRRDVPAPAIVVGPESTATAEPEPTAAPTAVVTAAPTAVVSVTATVSTELIGTVVQSGNVRSAPATNASKLGNVIKGDQLVFLGTSNGWYRVKLAAKHDANSIIQGSGEGWVSGILVTPPTAPVPTEKPAKP